MIHWIGGRLRQQPLPPEPDYPLPEKKKVPIPSYTALEVWRDANRLINDRVRITADAYVKRSDKGLYAVLWVSPKLQLATVSVADQNAGPLLEIKVGEGERTSVNLEATIDRVTDQGGAVELSDCRFLPLDAPTGYVTKAVRSSLAARNKFEEDAYNYRQAVAKRTEERRTLAFAGEAAHKHCVALTAAKEAREAAERARAEAKRRAEEEEREAKRKAEAEHDVNGLVLIRPTVNGVVNEFGIVTITGTVENRRSRTLRLVKITYHLYDDSGARVGSAFDLINNLEAGESWKFKAVGLVKASKYRLADLSGF
ncbi:MAG: FxLYD domain-containing protein [Gemmataceae bacterium]